MWFHFDFGSLVDTPVGTTSSAIGSKICVITGEIKEYRSMITKKKTKHDKIVLYARTKLRSM